MYAAWGFSSSSNSTGPLRLVSRGGRGGSGPSAWSQFLWRRRQPGSCFVHLVPVVSAMKGDAKENLKEIVLDRAQFKQQLRLRAVRIPKQHSHFVSKALSRFTLERPKLKHVIHDPESIENRLVLLAEHIIEADILEEKLNEVKKILPVDVVYHEIALDYRYYSVEQVLKEILPEGWKVPASFETVGHIAHLNLTDELLPYRKIIAEVFLDKNQPRIRTIVNKVGTISNEFRVPTWEVLAGDANLVTEVRQHNATFRLDFGLVYWNSRLEFEHKRLSSQFQPGQVILDMFAGIGPFAIPAAQRGCVVFANDLNPASVQYLEVNAKINKVAGNVNAYNMDAREFMRDLQRTKVMGSTIMEMVDEGCKGSSTKESTLTQVNSETQTPVKYGADAIDKWGGQSAKFDGFDPSVDYVVGPDGTNQTLKQELVIRKGKSVKGLKSTTSIAIAEAKPWELFHHVVMNLPASALEFLDVFEGLLSKRTWKGPMPRVHCYCFMRASEAASDVVKRAESILGGAIQDPLVWTVRDVAPNKIMLCISFGLPEPVAFKEPVLLEQLTNGDGKNEESEVVPSAQLTHLQNKRLRMDS